MISTAFSDQLLNWFDHHGRHDLPWQQTINPYRVWLSEIMLQQTQVKTVIPYFQRFIAAFPNVQALAATPIDKVLHLWTGLGYYARARNLHKAAQLIVNDHAGRFPCTLETLQTLPGIGRSTAAAICAIAFGQQEAILDGNVKRVLARYHAIEGWPGQSTVQKQLWQLAEAATPTERCADYTQAIMDLGATLCTRHKPNCQACPFQTNCQAHTKAATDQYPTRKPAKKLLARSTYFLIISDSNNRILLQQRPPVGLWGGLWCFPQCEDQTAIQHTCEQVGITFTASSAGPGSDPNLTHDYQIGKPQRHTFSHYHLDYTPVYIALHQRNAAITSQIAEDNIAWVNPDNPGQRGLPRPVERLLKSPYSIKHC